MRISKLGLVLRGMAMGIAEVIPGVSGGTIAFITGIYKSLLDTIKAFDHHALKDLTQFKWEALWKRINGPFILFVISGMVAGILIGVFGVTHLLETYPEALWALFFGLIIASIPMMFSQMDQRKLIHIFPFVIGAAFAYLITSISPAVGSTNYLYIFFAGVVAISALVLPGISGSFILLLLGLYTVIVPTIKTFLESPSLSEFILLAVFGLGCITGLVLFSRIVSKAFEKYHDTTIALMCGFMLGSLNKIWPWRNVTSIMNKENGIVTAIESNQLGDFDLKADNIKIYTETNVLPSDYFSDPQVGLVIAGFVVGILLIATLTLKSK